MFNFDDFSYKELNSDVRKSGLYDVEKIMDRMEKLYEAKNNFHVTSKNREWYDTRFDKLKPQAGLLSEEKVRNLCQFLPDSTLTKIWKLSDRDKDGFLDRHEFRVAYHLMMKAYHHGEEIPDQVVIYSVYSLKKYT